MTAWTYTRPCNPGSRSAGSRVAQLIVTFFRGYSLRQHELLRAEICSHGTSMCFPVVGCPNSKGGLHSGWLTGIAATR